MNSPEKRLCCQCLQKVNPDQIAIRINHTTIQICNSCKAENLSNTPTTRLVLMDFIITTSISIQTSPSDQALSELIRYNLKYFPEFEFSGTSQEDIEFLVGKFRQSNILPYPGLDKVVWLLLGSSKLFQISYERVRKFNSLLQNETYYEWS